MRSAYALAQSCRFLARTMALLLLCLTILLAKSRSSICDGSTGLSVAGVRSWAVSRDRSRSWSSAPLKACAYLHGGTCGAVLHEDYAVLLLLEDLKSFG